LLLGSCKEQKNELFPPHTCLFLLSIHV